MKRQISTTNTSTATGFLVVGFLLIFIGHSFIYWLNSVTHSKQLLNTPLPAPFLILLLFLLFYYLFIGRFYRIEIDETDLYYYGHLKKGKISLNNLTSVNREWVPYNAFNKRAYGISISYHNAEGKQKKIRFLSKENGLFENPDKIPELIELKKIIKRNNNTER